MGAKSRTMRCASCAVPVALVFATALVAPAMTGLPRLSGAAGRYRTCLVATDFSSSRSFSFSFARHCRQKRFDPKGASDDR
jgi:hypothetical protein